MKTHLRWWRQHTADRPNAQGVRTGVVFLYSTEQAEHVPGMYLIITELRHNDSYPQKPTLKEVKVIVSDHTHLWEAVQAAQEVFDEMKGKLSEAPDVSV